MGIHCNKTLISPFLLLSVNRIKTKHLSPSILFSTFGRWWNFIGSAGPGDLLLPANSACLQLLHVVASPHLLLYPFWKQCQEAGVPDVYCWHYSVCRLFFQVFKWLVFTCTKGPSLSWRCSSKMFSSMEEELYFEGSQLKELSTLVLLIC